jgi:ribonucleoside-triphosphate reductase
LPRRRYSGLKVLKAASSTLRLEVLNLLYEKGSLSYTEMMNILNLSPTRDAGRFAYHLKTLLKTDLIEPDTDTKKYRLTDLGKTMINFREDIEKQFFKRKKMMVRTSRFSVEEFDRNKIVDSLIKEAGVPVDSAQKIARETERRLSEFKTKYLTAPLIREIVNTILIQKGLEEYRHKLTRLGLPVYDVTQLLKATSTKSLGVEAVHKAAGDAVIEEYTLLNVLARDIADAHLSGTLHLNNLGCWILKPSKFMHDLRFFFQHGLKTESTDFTRPSYPPPKNLRSAILTASNIIKIASTEVIGEQALDYFNVFLAPFTQNLSPGEIKESLRLFVLNLNQFISNTGIPLETSVGLELLIPAFLEKKTAVGPDGKITGTYADFVEESRLITSLLLELMLEDEKHRPLLNPSLIIKIRPEALRNKECKSLLFQSHQLAAEKGIPYFANLRNKNQKHASYTATGFRLAADWKKDWELDTLQTGSVDSVILNLPRATYEAEGKQSKFLKTLDEQLEMALRALKIKYLTLKQRVRERLLPFLTQKADGDPYLRLENASHLISFIGLNEAVQSFLGKSIYEDEGALNFAKETLEYLHESVQKYAKKPETRAVLSMVPSADASRRLVELDVEKYGWAKVRASGTRDQPFYTDFVVIPFENSSSWEKRLSIEANFHELTPGSHLAIIQLPHSQQDPNKLLSVTKEICRTHCLGFYTYNHALTHCTGCQRTFYGLLDKCPSCGAVNMLVRFTRLGT